MADPGTNCVVRTEVQYEKPIFHLIRNASDISLSPAQKTSVAVHPAYLIDKWLSSVSGKHLDAWNAVPFLYYPHWWYWNTLLLYSVLRIFWARLRCPVGCSLGYANITSLRDWSVARTPFYHKDLFTVTKWKGKQETLILNLSTFSSTRVEGLKKKVARQWGEPKSQGQGWVQAMCLYWKLPLLTDMTLCRHLLLILCFLK